ncbi:50S ribosomal protein L9 [Patescibacteria group bacterium]|nr:50S ribosomal protein L9 [Patescibacteria group bacterium]
MQVVFIKELSGVGKRGEIKDFNDGYARNFLIAKGFAQPATPQIISKLRNEQAQYQAKQQKIREQNLKMKSELDKRTFTIAVKVGDKDQIFGSVHDKDVQHAIQQKTGFTIEKNQIAVPKQIKMLGEYEVEIKLMPDIIAKPKIKLIKQE